MRRECPKHVLWVCQGRNFIWLWEGPNDDKKMSQIWREFRFQQDSVLFRHGSVWSSHCACLYRPVPLCGSARFRLVPVYGSGAAAPESAASIDRQPDMTSQGQQQLGGGGGRLGGGGGGGGGGRLGRGRRRLMEGTGCGGSLFVLLATELQHGRR